MIPRTLFTEEHELFRSSLREFIRKEIIPHEEAWEQQGHISREAWLKAGEMGFLCPCAPIEYGGSGADFLYAAIMMEELGRSGCMGPGFPLHSDIAAPYILHYGTEEQKKLWIPKLASGQTIAAIAMTEPSAGSDLQGIKTTAVRQAEHYIVNGSKTFITNGYMSDLVIVVVKTGAADAGSKAFSLLLMDSGMTGFTKGKLLKKIGLKSQDTCELFFDQVKVPVTNLLGKEGEGFNYLMQSLPQERLLVGILGIAVAETALEKTIQYTKERITFGKPVAAFQNTRFKLAELATEIQMGQIFVDKCIELHLKNKLDASTAAMVKYSMSDLQCKVVDECLQFHGGYGYMWEYYIARAYADSRVQKIYAGSNEIMKEIIAKQIFA